MARPLRPEYPGAVYYISSVGNRGQSVFQNSDDGNAWIEVLEGVCGRFGCRCFGYCLMSDGYHLVIETPNPNLSKTIRQFKRRLHPALKQTARYRRPRFPGKI